MYSKIIELTNKIINRAYGSTLFNEKLIVQFQTNLTICSQSPNYQNLVNVKKINDFFNAIKVAKSYDEKIKILSSLKNFEVARILVNQYLKNITAMFKTRKALNHNAYNILPVSQAQFIADLYHGSIINDDIELFILLNNEIAQLSEDELITKFASAISNNANHIIEYLIEKLSVAASVGILVKNHSTFLQSTYPFVQKNILKKLLAKNPAPAIKAKLFFALLTSEFSIDVKRLLTDILDHNFDLNYVDEEGFAALHHVIKLGSASQLVFLIAKGANVNLQTINEQDTPLHLAIKFSKKKKVAILLQANPDLEITNAAGYTGLLQATLNHDVDIAKLLIAAGADIENQGLIHFSPLHFAAQYENSPILDYLILKGANLSALDFSGQTALHRAIVFYCLTNIKKLIKAKAEVENKKLYYISPLHEALKRNHPAAVEFLIAHGADLKAECNQGYNAWQLAVMYCNAETLAIIHKSDKTVDIVTKDKDNLLHLAVTHKKSENIKYLVSLNVSTKATNCDGYTPITLAIIKDDVASCAALLATKVNINPMTKDGNSLINLAVANGNLSILNLLVANKFDVNIVAIKNNFTAIDTAIYHQNKAMFSALIRLKADFNPKNRLTAKLLKKTGSDMLSHIFNNFKEHNLNYEMNANKNVITCKSKATTVAMNCNVNINTDNQKKVNIYSASFSKTTNNDSKDRGLINRKVKPLIPTPIKLIAQNSNIEQSVHEFLTSTFYDETCTMQSSEVQQPPLTTEESSLTLLDNNQD